MVKPGKQLLQEDGEIEEGPASPAAAAAAAKDAEVAAVLSELDDETIQDGGGGFHEQPDSPLTGFDKSLIKRRAAKHSKPRAVGRLECAMIGLFNQLPSSASPFQMLSTGSLPDEYVR